MSGATALFSDGLDLVAEFLACSRPADGAIETIYDDLAQWRAVAAELARWSTGDVPQAGTIHLDEAGLRIAVPEALWNRLYARALDAGRASAPDRLGLAMRGAGGMLASLSAIPAMAQAVLAASSPAALAGGPGAPWLLMPWRPLRALLLRDRLMTREALRPRPLFGKLPADASRLEAAVQQYGFLLQQPGGPTQLVCPQAWQARIAGKLARHFTESVLLLFRLMFFSADQGWGWDPESAQVDGLVALMDDAHAAGLAEFGPFRDRCAALAGAVASTGARDGLSACRLALAAAVDTACAMWPTDYLAPLHPSRHLLGGWMAEMHPTAHIPPGTLLGPGVEVGRGCVIGKGVVLHGGATIGAGVVVPPGVVVAPGASVQTLTLSDVVLPPGTVLRGSVTIYRGASIGMGVVLGADCEVGFGVAIPEGVQVADEAGVHMLRLGAEVRLPAGTVIEGSVTVEADALIGERVRLGNNSCIRRGAFIGDGVSLPANVIVAGGARVRECSLATGAVIGLGTLLYGDIALGRRAQVGAGVQLGEGAVIGADVVIPAGVTVQAGAQIDVLHLRGCTLPAGTVLGGSLSLGAGCHAGPNLVFEGDNQVGHGIALPGGLRIGRGARIARLRLSGAMLAPGTLVKGNVFVSPGTRIGRGVTLEDGATVSAASLPDGVIVSRDAVVTRCDVAGAFLERGVRLGGDLYLARDVRVGANVRFRHGVEIMVSCRIPPGVEFLRNARVECFSIAPDVTLPPGTRVAGNLFIRRGVRVGAGVLFGAGAVVGRGVSIPNGAHIGRRATIRHLRIAPDAVLPDSYTLHGDAFIGSGAVIGARAVLGANVWVGDGVVLPPGSVLQSGTRLDSLRIADDVVVPTGTMLGGDLVLRRGVRLGRNVELGAGADIGPHVDLPDGVVVCPGARVDMVRIAAGVTLAPGTVIAGGLIVGAGVTVEPDVRFGAGVLIEEGGCIGCGVHLPDGTIVSNSSRVQSLDIGVDVRLPAKMTISGDLWLEDGVVVGEGVRFGAGVVVRAGAVLGAGAVIGDDAVIGAGAVLGENAVIPASAAVPAGLHLAPGQQVAIPARAETPPAADAHFLLWQQFLSRHASTSPVQTPEVEPEITPSMPASSPPVAIPLAHYPPPRGPVLLPWPYG